MQKNVFFSILFLFVVLVSCDDNNKQINLMNNIDISMFPTSKEGMSRFIIQLEAKENEKDFKVEIYAGKMAEIDCNTYNLLGDFEQMNLKGWGYSFYNFNSNGMIVGTRKGCPESSKHQAFVSSTSKLIRYNSKLPIVVYLPKGIELKYKIWQRNDEEFSANNK